MGFRFFKRIQLAPGISINLSRSGVSASLGPRGAKVTLGPRGIRKTVGLPGTGMYYTTHSSWKSKKKTPPPSPEEASAAEEESAAEEPQLALGFFDRLVTPENEENFIDGLRAFLEGELEKALDFFSRSPECPDGAFVGGIIAPGAALGARSLNVAAAKLPMIELRSPTTVIGRNTRAAMESGVVLGEIARIDGLLDAIADEVGYESPVVLTGDGAEEMSSLLRHETTVDASLTLRGLWKLWKTNQRR